VSGTVDVDKAHTYAGQIPGAALTLCRLRVGHDDQKMRLAERGWSSDMLAEATQEAEALDHSDFADMSIDTSGLPILQVGRLVREQAGGWPSITKQAHVSSSDADTPAPHVRTVNTHPGPVLWLCGATGVGKSAVGFHLFMQVMRAGIAAAYVDLEQVGFLRPAPTDDPDNHRVKARNVAAMWHTFRASGARCLIIVGPVDHRDAVRTYADALPAGSLTLVRLHAGPDQLTERILLRGQGGGWPAPGDPLRGQPTATLHRIADQAVANADELERAAIDDVRVDTDGRTIEEVAELVCAQANGWPDLS